MGEDRWSRGYIRLDSSCTRGTMPRARCISRDAHSPNACELRTFVAISSSCALSSIFLPRSLPNERLVLPPFFCRKTRACAYVRTSATRPSSAALLPPLRLSSPHLLYSVSELQLSVPQRCSTIFRASSNHYGARNRARATLQAGFLPSALERKDFVATGPLLSIADFNSAFEPLYRVRNVWIEAHYQVNRWWAFREYEVFNKQDLYVLCL